jgi:hypothetical protein
VNFWSTLSQGMATVHVDSRLVFERLDQRIEVGRAVAHDPDGQFLGGGAAVGGCG